MNRIQKNFRIWNIVLFVLAMLGLVYYDYRGGLWLKGVTSAWFVLIGLVNLIYAVKRKCGNVRFLALMELALILGMTADVLLGIQFMVGVAVFALGHVGYFAAFCAAEKFGRRDFACILAVGVISLFIVIGTPFIHVEDSVLKIFMIIYAVVISCMLGKAISNLIAKKSLSRKLLAIGSMMFWFSDLMLALAWFGNGGEAASLLCTYTYWPGQCLLAHSIYHFVNEE